MMSSSQNKGRLQVNFEIPAATCCAPTCQVQFAKTPFPLMRAWMRLLRSFVSMATSGQLLPLNTTSLPTRYRKAGAFTHDKVIRSESFAQVHPLMDF